jgi:hypothetical protein
VIGLAIRVFPRQPNATREMAEKVNDGV